MMRTPSASRFSMIFGAAMLLTTVAGCAQQSSEGDDQTTGSGGQKTVAMEGYCDSEPFDQQLKDSAASKEVMLTGKLTLTGKLLAQPENSAATYTEVAITQAKALVGSSLPDTLTAYIAGGVRDGVTTDAGDADASNWADDGQFWGVLRSTHGIFVLSALPLVAGNILLTGVGCWNATTAAPNASKPAEVASADIYQFDGVAAPQLHTGKYPEVKLSDVQDFLQK